MSAYSAAGKYVDQSWEFINRSQTYESGNWDWGHAIPRKGIQKWYFSCSVQRQGWLVLCRTQRRIYAVSFHHNYQAKDMPYIIVHIKHTRRFPKRKKKHLQNHK
jgi:hypothetical protein